MAVKNPKNKGNGFERKVAKMLSEWAGVKFMRTPSSGAIHNFQDKRVVSDIVAPLSIGQFPFSIECKNVECSWEWSTFLEGTSVTINKHWDQCVTDARREGLVPLLVVTKNFRDIYGVMPSAVWELLPYESVRGIPILVLDGVCDEPLVVFKFSALLEHIRVEDVVSLPLLKNIQHTQLGSN